MGWNERVAIVTGASSGIGLSTARKMVERGARVALVARTRDKLEAVARELGEDKAVPFPLDVTDRGALEALPRRVVTKLGRLDVVVNNAGTNHRGSVEERSTEDLLQILETNLVAPVILTRACLKHLGRGGVVVNVASLAGKIPVPHEATYSASKAGLRAFSRAADLELEHAGRGVRVVCVNPGPVDTGFFGEVKDVPDLVFSQPMSTADEIADAVLRAVETGAHEIDVPALSGKLATAGYLSPRAFAFLRPIMEKRGARAKARYIASKRS
jgi:short-subunit dehydrogenase